MIVSPLSGRPTAIRDALLSHGWEGDVCRLTADGVSSAAFHATGVSLETLEAMLSVASRLGLELITGDDWLILAGARSRLGAFARPWVQPEPVRDLALALGMAMPPEAPTHWQHARGALPLDAPVLVGVLNVTPDSFSDGGEHVAIDAAIALAERLLAGGATIVDVGGESTRPGAAPVDAADEFARVIPVIAELARRFPELLVSIDTVRGSTALAALDAGAAIVNDVTAGRHDPTLLEVTAARGAGLVLSHSRGDLGRLASYDHADYGAAVTDMVVRELSASRAEATRHGVKATAITLDPGFGFGKTPEQNFRLLDQLDALVALGSPVLVGPSRKRFLGVPTGREIDDRDRATAAACAIALDRGARLFRVHDPAAARDALLVVDAVQRSRA